jgi:hypothetical protein
MTAFLSVQVVFVIAMSETINDGNNAQGPRNCPFSWELYCTFCGMIDHIMVMVYTLTCLLYLNGK